MGLIILILIIVPIAWAHLKREKKEKAILKKLEAAAGQNPGNIAQHDIWNNYAIALTTNGAISYLDSNSNNAVAFNLAEAAACRISNSGRDFNAIATNINEVNRLELMVGLKQQNKPLSLVFFKEEENIFVNEEIRLIKKWNELINNNIR